MKEDCFIPHHVAAEPADLAGNNGLGRYIFLPGSDGRAKAIADHFDNLEVCPSARAHNLYKGTLRHHGKVIEVAAVCSGMGTPSLDIIVNELFKLGATRFLRVGTAGSLQPDRIRVGHIVIGTAGVRDEGASRVYVPLEFPSVASFSMVQAAQTAAAELGMNSRVIAGFVHSKDSLFAREMGEGPMRKDNESYMALLREAGVAASEMEAAHLFVLGSLFSQQLQRTGDTRGVLCGAVLGIIGDDQAFATDEIVKKTVEDTVQLALATVKMLAVSELTG